MAHKVLFIHHGGGIGGAPVSMLQLAAALDRDRYEPVVVFTEPGPILEFARDLGVPAKVFPLRSSFFYSTHVPISLRMIVRFLFHLWPTIRAARTLIRREQPDLVHLNTSVLIPAAMGVKREGVPLVWHVREVIDTGSWIGGLEAARISNLADCVVANSEVVANGFNGRGRVTRVPNAVDLSKFDHTAAGRRAALRQEFEVERDAPVVGIIGSVQTPKGHFTLVDAACNVVRSIPQAVFLVVGGGLPATYLASWKGRAKRMLGIPLDERERMQRMVAKAGLESSFRFVGYRQDIAAVLGAMDVLAFPVLKAEGFGRPLIEAMAAACPVVASDIGPSREIMGGESGLLVPPGDPEALSEALIDLLTDPQQRARMGPAGRRRAEAMFSLDRHVQHIQRLYEEVLGGRVKAEVGLAGAEDPG